MQLSRRFVLGSLAAAALPGCVSARTPARAYAATRALLERYVAEGKLAGAVAAFVTPGRFEPTYISAGRTAMSQAAIATGPDALYRIFSMTKPITGMAAMRAISEGRLKLDQPVADFYPGFADLKVLVDPAKDLTARPARGVLTVRHLLTHSGGLSYAIVGNGPLEREYKRLGLQPGSPRAGLQPGDGAQPSLQEFAERLSRLPLVSDPGTAWRYSVGLDLLGAVLEKVHGRTLDRVLAEAVLEPCGMADTFFQVPADKQFRLTALPVQMRGRLVEMDAPPRSAWAEPPVLISGGGGLVSSARDYSRFAQMVLTGGVLDGRRVFPADAVRLGTSDLLPANVSFPQSAAMGGQPQGFGAGGRVVRAGTPGDEQAGAYGWGGAAGTAFSADPKRGLGVVLMVQFLPDTIYPLREEFRKTVNADVG